MKVFQLAFLAAVIALAVADDDDFDDYDTNSRRKKQHQC